MGHKHSLKFMGRSYAVGRDYLRFWCRTCGQGLAISESQFWGPK